MAQTQGFSVPMANMNLPPSEALNQILDNLNHLNVIVNQAVNTINFRIKQESLLLSSISKRVNDAYNKTQIIAQNPNKSTTIYSLSNYPTNDNNDNNNNNNDNGLINKTEMKSKPIRKNYNLSLKERNEKPSNVETVSLLQSINNKTIKQESIDDDNNNNSIPEWVSSVADCMVFGTNRNAYYKCNNNQGNKPLIDKRKRKKERINKLNDDRNKDIGPQPNSINDPFYNLKLQQKTYGDRIRYLPDSAKKNMPKFKLEQNINNNIGGIVANDIKWNDNNYNNNNDDEAFLIPSDVINKQFGDIDDDKQFEFGDNVEPPTMDNNIHIYPTPKEPTPPQQQAKTIEAKVKQSSEVKQVIVIEEEKKMNKMKNMMKRKKKEV